MPSSISPVLQSTMDAEGDAVRYSIGRVAVLGAGTMGARIAAHVANAGLPVLLLDRVASAGERNSLGKLALANLLSSKPAALASPAAAALVDVGNFEDDLPKLKGYDWVIEAVAEDLEIKRSLLARAAPYFHSSAIMTTNTSGLRVAQIAAQLPSTLRQRWFGAHFFNPPRYMRLVEIIATPEADPAAVQTISSFCDHRLGKEVVPANDVQNFIANRIGVFSLLNSVKLMQELGLSVEEVDVLTGQIVGWPKSGTFRLADMVGIDVLVNIARNFVATAADERSDVVLPQMFSKLIEHNWLGDKTRQGFYKKDRDGGGKEVRQVLDPSNFEYKPASEVSLPAVDQAKRITPLAARLRSLFMRDAGSDKAAQFLWRALPELWAYSANRIGEVSESLADIDRAMTAGFNWELGPFAMWDAVGVKRVVEVMHDQNIPIPTAVEKLLAAGLPSWYRADGAEYFNVRSGAYRLPRSDAARTPITSYKQSHGIFAGNSDVSLVDIGEGIGCFELHSKMNALGETTVNFLQKELAADSQAVRHFDGFVIATDAPYFSVGANIKQLLVSAQGGQWDQVRSIIERFQGMTQAVKFCPRPVVSAPAGMCFGGGCEIVLHSARRQAHFELSAGLVETGVGLLPGGGGCKEMLLRALSDAERVRADKRGESVEVLETLRSVLETILMAKVSTSAPEARSLRLLSEVDGITMNRSRLLSDAREQAVRLVSEGYNAPPMRHDIVAPGRNVFATLQLAIYLFREGEFISDLDVNIATHIARILTGGDVTPGTLLSEQHLLDMEREAFISLCGEPKTQERMAFTLKTGKPLRN